MSTSELSIITLDPRSELVGLANMPPRIPTVGEKTAAQSAHPIGGVPGSSAAGLAGFLSAPAGTYHTYRQISAHPTNALVRGIVTAPVIANSWQWKKCRADVPDEWVVFAQRVMAPLRQSLVHDALRALEFGWVGFEKVWTIEGGRRILSRLKPLQWDFTEILLDEHGNPAGLLNQPPGEEPVVLGKGKFFLYSYDGEAGNPYGRSRHENVR
jgi:hypothetical protein